VSTHLPKDAQERKKIPLWSGLFRYFPDALVAVARVSQQGNDQHNPGQPLHWAREKSKDQEDTLLRHLLESGTKDVDGFAHSAKVAWRALAMLQLEIEKEKQIEQAYIGDDSLRDQRFLAAEGIPLNPNHYLDPEREDIASFGPYEVPRIRAGG
jgi:hypothetical protein